MKTIINTLLKKSVLLIIIFLRFFIAQSNAQTDSIKNVVIFSERMPEYPGGVDAMSKFLQENIVYPPDAKAEGVTGKVILQLVITDEGEIRDVQNVKKDIDKRLVDEAIRVVNLMPNWLPGNQDGKNVSVKFTLPIVFKLSRR